MRRSGKSTTVQDAPGWPQKVVIAGGIAAVLLVIGGVVAAGLVGSDESAGPEAGPGTSGAPTPADAETSASPTPVTESETTSATPTPKDDRAEWAVADRVRADVDGDGVAEPVLLRLERDLLVSERAQLVVDLSGTGAVRTVVDGPGTLTWSVHEVVQLDADPADELILWRELNDGWVVTAIDLRDGGWDVVTPPESGPPLRVGYQDRHELTVWVENGVLFSSRAEEPTVFGSHDAQPPERTTLEVWSWSLAAADADEAGPQKLVPQQQPPRCKVAGSAEPSPGPC